VTNTQPSPADRYPGMKLPDKPTLSVEETAALLGISRNHAFKAIHTGALPAMRVGRRLLVPTSRLQALLDDVPDEMGPPRPPTPTPARSTGRQLGPIPGGRRTTVHRGVARGGEAGQAEHDGRSPRWAERRGADATATRSRG
jgi:excisionase family DNA binding protein